MPLIIHTTSGVPCTLDCVQRAERPFISYRKTDGHSGTFLGLGCESNQSPKETHQCSQEDGQTVPRDVWGKELCLLAAGRAGKGPEKGSLEQGARLQVTRGRIPGSTTAARQPEAQRGVGGARRVPPVMRHPEPHNRQGIRGLPGSAVRLRVNEKEPTGKASCAHTCTGLHVGWEEGPKRTTQRPKGKVAARGGLKGPGEGENPGTGWS